MALKSGRQRLLDLLDEAVDVASSSPSSLPPNLWTSEQSSHGVGGVQRGDQVGAALGAVDVLVDAVEDLLDLLVQLVAVGDDQHAGVGDVLANPLGQPHHGQALAAALRVPDDAALAPLHMLLRRPDAEILVVAAELLHAGVEDHEVVDQLEEARLVAQLEQRTVERVLDGGSSSFQVR